MKTLKLILTLIIIIIITGCTDNPVDPDYNKDFDTISQMDLKSAVALADSWKFTSSKVSSYITPSELVITFPDSRKVKKQLPDSVMYVAVAPYIKYTHECETHYLSSCQGELSEKDFRISIIDENMYLIFDGPMKSNKNGFIEFWLPREMKFTLRILYDTLTCEQVITTSRDSHTCITTAQLK